MESKETSNDLQWYDASKLTIEGKAWQDTDIFYHRLPARAKDFVNERHWLLSRCPSGMTVHFTTNTSTLYARWDAPPDAAGYTGIDLYVKHEGKWKWVSVGTSTEEPTGRKLFSDIPSENRDYMLYLPMFFQIEKMELGIPKEFELKETTPRTEKPVLFYGTSITQGSRASRAGMLYSGILGRWLDRPVLNLGFSGNGNMDPKFIELLCELDPAVYILDCLPNLVAEQVNERLEPAIEKLCQVHPDTPLVLVEMFYCDAFLKPERFKRYTEANSAQFAIYEKLVNDGVKNLHYVTGDDLLGTDGDATIDGTHYTDVGYMRYSEKLFKVLNTLI